MNLSIDASTSSFDTLMVGYIVVAYVIRSLLRVRSKSELAYIRIIFDAGTFATSTLVIWGIMYEPVFNALGSTKLYLTFAGIVGIGYSLHCLLPKRDDRRFS